MEEKSWDPEASKKHSKILNTVLPEKDIQNVTSRLAENSKMQVGSEWNMDIKVTWYMKPKKTDILRFVWYF